MASILATVKSHELLTTAGVSGAVLHSDLESCSGVEADDGARFSRAGPRFRYRDRTNLCILSKFKVDFSPPDKNIEIITSSKDMGP